MHDSNHKDEFEEYLQHQVSEHRMYPSDKVWKNIRNCVHTPKKWPALSVFAVMIISGLVIGTVLNKPMPDSITPNFVYSLQNAGNIKEEKPGNDTKAVEQPIDNNYAAVQLTTRTITEAVEKIKTDEENIADEFKINNNVLPTLPSNNASLAAATNMQNIQAANVQQPDKNSPNNIIASTNFKPDNSFSGFKNIDNYFFDITSRLKSILNSPVHHTNGGVAFFQTQKNDNTFDDFDLLVPAEHKDYLPTLAQLGKASSRFDFRFYVTPSISYRRFKEGNPSNKANKTSGASLESDYRIDPSLAINHSPAIGYETGFGLGYKLNKKFSLTGGVQFNISQYKINAFSYKDEPTALTLNEGDFASTINTVSSVRSVSGTKPLTIRNRYYQISMPLGIEWHILGNEKLNWGMAAAMQPTYTFDKQPLIISSNYKNYADGSAYVRNLNVNANVETYFGYNTGSYRWQIGPQLRYQVLPSLENKYPNKEYLINYGLKLGVVKKLR